MILQVTQKPIGSDPSSSQLNKNSGDQIQDKNEPVDHIIIKRKSQQHNHLNQIQDCNLPHSLHSFNRYETKFNSIKRKIQINLRTSTSCQWQKNWR